MIDLFVQSRYKVDRQKLKKRVGSFLEKLGISLADYHLSLAIVGDRKMRELNEKYRRRKGTTPVLAFPLSGSAAPHFPAATPLGEIVVSYPQALLLASQENKLLDEKIGELVEHGLRKLLTGS